MKKLYYHVLVRKDCTPVISSTKQYIADILGVSMMTMNRHLQRGNEWISEEFSVYINVPLYRVNKLSNFGRKINNRLKC